MKINNFQDLTIWQKAHSLLLKIYDISYKFPKTEIYCLTSQIRRAALSVPTNIAEGFGRYHYGDYIKFLLNSRGSVDEVRSLLIAAKDLKYITANQAEKFESEYEGLKKGINSFISKLNSFKKS